MRRNMGNSCNTTRTRDSFSEGGDNGAKKPNNTGTNYNLLSISASFKFHDLKNDGVIDKDELTRYFKSDKTASAIIERLDKNKDGVISYTEFYSELSKIKDGEATLSTYLERFPLQSEAVTPKAANSPRKLLNILKNPEVPLTWASHIDESVVDKAIAYGPFVDWMNNINQIENADPTKPDLIIDKVHIQHVDMFGPRIGFIKFEVAARKWNEKMNQIAFVPGIVFMRGGAVGILCILIEQETGKEYSLITLQPRIPVGYADFPEIPAGMLDGELNNKKFAGKAAKEMNEETMLEIKEEELFDLTGLAFQGRYNGMYPSAGGCDEFLKLFLFRRYMSRRVLQLLRVAHCGDGPSEVIKLKLVPLEDLWREAPDAKALSALYLYNKFLELKIEHPPSPRNEEQEEQLVALLQPKVAQKEIPQNIKGEERKQIEENIKDTTLSLSASVGPPSPSVQKKDANDLRVTVGSASPPYVARGTEKDKEEGKDANGASTEKDETVEVDLSSPLLKPQKQTSV